MKLIIASGLCICVALSGALAWRLGPGRTLDLSVPRLMAVLNVTPDSFSDGGDRFDPGAAVAAGLALATGSGVAAGEEAAETPASAEDSLRAAIAESTEALAVNRANSVRGCSRRCRSSF